MQALSVLAATAVLYLPAAQDVHDVMAMVVPVRVLYMPATQLVHDALWVGTTIEE